MKRADPGSLAVEAQMATWIQQNGFRLMVVYRKGGAYQAAAKAIEANLDARFADAQKELGPLVFSSLRDHYAVHEVTETDGLDTTMSAAVGGALVEQPGIAACYSIGGGNSFEDCMQ